MIVADPLLLPGKTPLQAVQIPNLSPVVDRVAREDHPPPVHFDQVTDRAVSVAGRSDRTDPGRTPIQRLPVLIGVVDAQRFAQHQMVRMEVVEVPAAGGIAPVGGNLVELVAFAGGNADLGTVLFREPVRHKPGRGDGA